MSTTPIYTVIVEALNTVLGAVFPQFAPADTSPPYIVYSVAASAPENTLADGVSIDNLRYQVDVYASTYSDVQRIAKLVRAAMLAIAYPVSVVALSQIDAYESDVRLHRVISEFSVWFNQ